MLIMGLNIIKNKFNTIKKYKMLVFHELMPIGYSKQPKLEKFIIL